MVESFPDVLANGKKSVGVNLKSNEGAEVFRKLCGSADILIDPFRKGWHRIESIFVQFFQYSVVYRCNGEARIRANCAAAKQSQINLHQVIGFRTRWIFFINGWARYQLFSHNG